MRRPLGGWSWIALALLGACGTGHEGAAAGTPERAPPPRAEAPPPPPAAAQPAVAEVGPAPGGVAPATPPAAIDAGPAVDCARLALGSAHGLAIGGGGAVYQFPLEWGASSTTARRVEGVDGARCVAIELERACAATHDGRVVCWSTARSGTTPTPVPRLDDTAALALTDHEVCARSRAGVVACSSSRAAAEGGARVPSLPRPAVQIAAGMNHVAALLDDRSVWTLDERAAPRQVPTPWPVGSIAHRDEHLCMRRDDGSAVACLGDIGEWYHVDIDFQDDERGSVSQMEYPVREPAEVAGLPTGIVAIASHVQNACALTAGGAVHCWGTPYRDGRREGLHARPAPGLTGITELVAGGDDQRGYACAIQGDLPVCFTSERRLGSSTPGSPRFSICRPDGPPGGCTELRLGPRDGDNPPAADAVVAPAALAPAVAATLDLGAEAAPTGTPCVVADASGTPLNVRADPSVRAEVVSTLPDGTEVTSDEIRGRFRHLSAPVRGWVWGEALRCR